MGSGHKTTGIAAGAVFLAAGVGAGAAVSPLAGAGVAGQVAFVATVAGFSLAPDCDQHGSTAGRMWGPVSSIPTRIIGTVAGGHRKGTHSLLGVAVAGAIAAWAPTYRWPAVVLVAVAVGLALVACSALIPGRLEHVPVVNLAVSVAAGLTVAHFGVDLAWMPTAVVLGCLVHLAGDAITVAGVPLLWPLSSTAFRIPLIRAGGRGEPVVVGLVVASSVGFIAWRVVPATVWAAII